MTPNLKVLSCDGGGIRGLASLLVLRNLMDALRDSEYERLKIKAEEEGTEVIERDQIDMRPCKHFDLIIGTSTGGLIAISEFSGYELHLAPNPCCLNVLC